MSAAGGDIVEDVLAPGLGVVFCGTRPSTASAERRAYYAKPGNRFWPALYEIGLTPRLFRPEEYRAVLPLGIGLTDVAKTTAGQDATMAIEDIDIERLWQSMERFRPNILAFTSKTAAMLALGARRTGKLPYGVLEATVAGIELHVLPSTSGLATSYWDIEPWRALAGRLREMGYATA